MEISASELNCKITIYGKEKAVNELGETFYRYEPVRSPWARIRPASGGTAQLAGNTERAEITHRVVVRAKAMPEIQRGMYFLFRGQKYHILYGQPVYNRTGWLELMCRLEVEDSVPGH